MLSSEPITARTRLGEIALSGVHSCATGPSAIAPFMVPNMPFEDKDLALLTPIALVHATLQPGAELDLPWRPDFNALVYALSGRGSVGAERVDIQAGQLAVYGAGDRIVVTASEHQDRRTPALDVLILGGLPIREPVAWLGPFVMNTRDEVIQAFEDYKAGRLGVTPAAHSNPHNTPTSVIES
mgnify:CR=1 FL=1